MLQPECGAQTALLHFGRTNVRGRSFRKRANKWSSASWRDDSLRTSSLILHSDSISASCQAKSWVVSIKKKGRDGERKRRGETMEDSGRRQQK